uniref:T9SS type A sorting domain-containing protein n=1 Tax=candidate division WOR-3 bacterium TaxID=2052148 RepID=A0A7C6A9S9_UNCW3
MKSSLFIVILCLSLASGQNILLNPSFEIWLDTLGVNLPLGWFTSEINFPGSATKTTDAHSGNFALKLVGGDSIAFATTTSIVRANNQYDFRGWCKCVSYVGGSFVINWLTILGNPVGIPTILPISFSTNYRNYTRSVTAPDSAVFVVVTVAALPQATIYVDDVTLDSITTGLEEDRLSKSDYLIIQPNPFKNKTMIYVSNPGSELKIYDLTGKLVKSISFLRNYFLWDGSDNTNILLKPGIYFAQFSIGGRIYTHKIIRL